MSNPKRNQVAKLRTDVLSAQLEELASEDAEMLKGANAAALIRDWQLEEIERDLRVLPEVSIKDKYGGLTKRQLAVAADARRNSKEAPFYLRMLDARSQLRWRDGQGEKPSKPAAIILAGGRKPEVTERRGTVVVNLGGDDGK